jgi:PAS domain S-box-containing protein
VARRSPKDRAPSAPQSSLPLAVAAPHAFEALLALSRDLAQARTEAQIAEALSRALDALFPSRSFAIRLVEPSTLALRTLQVRGQLRPGAGRRMVLRRAALERAGVNAEALAGAVTFTDVDEPLFEGCEEAVAVPLGVGGLLFGVLNLEYGPDQLSLREPDAPLLYQLANHAALGVRNVRSIEELTYLKTYLENLIEHANGLIVVVNRKREVVVWNQALVKMTGLAKDRVSRANVLSLVRDEDRAGLEKVLQRGFEGEAVAGYELRVLRDGGGEARIAFNTAPVVGASGEVDDVIAIGQDLTLVRSLEAAAEHAERLAGIGRLVAGVVHELNNPLTAVNMYSDVLVEKLTHAGHDPADVEKLRAIHDAGQRIQRLARDLVAYARPGGARSEEVDLVGVVEEAARLAKPVFKERSAVVERAIPTPPPPPVQGVRASLVQVVLNLVTNAAQAIGDQGHVKVSLAREGDGVAIVVEDDGPGMPPEVAAHAFEPFFTTRPAQGIGLGLPIVLGIVERHGGKIGLESTPGRGTRVKVVLPVKR